MPTTLDSRETLYKIAAIPGDGIGVDITQAAKEVLNKLADCDGTFRFDFTDFDWSSKAYLERGWYMPEDAIATLKKHDAIYFGAVGWPSVPDHISLWNMILPIRKELNQFVNVRPTRILPGTKSPLEECQKDPKLLDWIIVRENSEGEYAGQGGTTHGHEKYAVATEVAIFTYVGIERIMRFAFETAKSRPRKKLTMVTKSNAQRHGMVLWDKVFYDVAKEYEGVVEHDKMLVDAMTVRMVNKPESMDVIVATNRKFLKIPPLTWIFGSPELTYTSPRRHPLRPSSRPRRLNRHRAILQPRSQPPVPQHVRAHPRLSTRYRRKGHCKSDWCFLVGCRDGAVGGSRETRRSSRCTDAGH
jgi:isocitrate/isopropylmalate dehydrogenase